MSVSQVFDDATSLDLIIPDTAISGSVETTLKIYPNPTAHVLESIAAILERPYGGNSVGWAGNEAAVSF